MKHLFRMHGMDSWAIDFEIVPVSQLYRSSGFKESAAANGVRTWISSGYIPDKLFNGGSCPSAGTYKTEKPTTIPNRTLLAFWFPKCGIVLLPFTKNNLYPYVGNDPTEKQGALKCSRKES